MSTTTAPRVSTVSRIYLIMALFVTLIFGLVWLVQIQMDTLTALRAYVGGEGLWAKAQRDAVRSLEHYVLSHDEADYQAYLRHVQVPLGDRQARIELQKDDPDIAVARAGFIQGSNHPDDIASAVRFFQRFQHSDYMTRVLRHWSAGDRMIAELNRVAEALREEIVSGRNDPQAIRAHLAQLDNINQQVTLEEDAFSSTLAEASRWTNGTARQLTLAMALLFAVLGVGLSWPIITRIRATEAALGESEARFRSIFEHVNDIIYTIEADGTFSSISPASERILGWHPDDWIGRPFSQIVHPDDLARMQKLFLKAQAGESLPVFQVHILTKTGTYMDAEITASLIHRRGSIAVAGVVRDISARKRAEAEIARLSQWNELLLNSAGEGIYGMDKDGNCTFVNPAALAILGFDRDEVLGQRQHHVFHHHRKDGSPYPEEDCPIYQTLHDGIPRKVEDTFIRKNGELFPVQISATPIHENDVLVGVEVVFQDISHRKKLEEELMHLATTDPLTGVANRRKLIEQLGMELARTRRSGESAAFLMVDIDHFKKVNDSFGHAIGDTVIQHLAELSRLRLRRVDLFGRLGGEEFGILLPSTNGTEAVQVAESFRRYVAETPAPSSKGDIPFTISIGVACLEPGDEAPDSVLARADVALYRAKEGGRNRVELCDGSAPAPVGRSNA